MSGMLVEVKVDVAYDTKGIAYPTAIYWHDGRRFDVTRVLYRCNSPTGDFEGFRFTILIGREEKYIYQVNEKWYVMTEGGCSG